MSIIFVADNPFEPGNVEHLPLVHLGRRRARRGIWAKSVLPAAFYDLDDVFDLQNAQSAHRQQRLAGAHRACEQRARELYMPANKLSFGVAALAHGS